MATFNLDAARKAGYTDDQIAQGLAAQQGMDYAAAVKAGYSASDMLPSLVQGITQAKPADATKPGLIEDIGTGLMSAGGKVLGALDKGAVALSDAMPDWMPGKMTPEEAAMYSARGKAAQQFANENAPQRWSGQVASGLAYAPFMGAAPLVMGGAEGTARSQLLQDQGIDAATANKAGLAEGVLQGAIGALPLGEFVTGAGGKVLAKSVASSVGKAAVAGAGQSVASDAATQAYLDANGYDEQAKQFAPSVEKAAEGALFMGAFHGGMQGAHLVAGKALDAATGNMAPQEAPAPIRDAVPNQSVADQLRAVLDEAPAAAGVVPRADLQAAKESTIVQAKAADPVATADAVLAAPTIDDAMRAADSIINAPLPGLHDLADGRDVNAPIDAGMDQSQTQPSTQAAADANLAGADGAFKAQPIEGARDGIDTAGTERGTDGLGRSGEPADEVGSDLGAGRAGTGTGVIEGERYGSGLPSEKRGTDAGDHRTGADGAADTQPALTPSLPGASWALDNARATVDVIRQRNPKLLEQVEELHAQDKTAGEIARQLNVTPELVRDLRNGMGLPSQGKEAGNSMTVVPADAAERAAFVKWRDERQAAPADPVKAFAAKLQPQADRLTDLRNEAVRKFNEAKAAKDEPTMLAMKDRIDGFDAQRRQIQHQIFLEGQRQEAARRSAANSETYGTMDVGTKIGMIGHEGSDDTYFQKVGPNRWQRTMGGRTDDVFKTDANMEGKRVIPSKEKTDAVAAVTFKTAKGSTYAVNPDGTTTRDKAARAEHPGEQGAQETSKRTVYMTRDEMSKLAEIQAKGGARKGLVFHDGDKKVAIRYLDGKDAGKIEGRTVASFQTEPAIGLHPVESWGDDHTVHFGNEITEVNRKESANVPERPQVPEEAPAASGEEAAQPSDAGIRPGADAGTGAAPAKSEGKLAARRALNDRQDAVVKAAADKLAARKAEKEPKPEPAVMTEEQYLARNGAGRQEYGEAALHRSSERKSENTHRQQVDAQAAKDSELTARRAALRDEYHAKVASGEIRPPNAKEETIERANADPALESTQAARRIADKRGWEWRKEQAAQQPAAEAPTPDANPARAEPPLSFMKKVKVDHDVYISDERRWETVKVQAHIALKSVREDIGNLEALLKCMRG